MRPDNRPSLTGQTILAALIGILASARVPAGSSAASPQVTRPAPPYTRFTGQSFEPSAAAFDPASGRVLVLSDHDSTLYRYELGAADSSFLPANVTTRSSYRGVCRWPSSRG